MDRDRATSSGIGFGAALAIAISWSENRSVPWAIFHGACNWFYVVYYCAGWWGVTGSVAVVALATLLILRSR